VGRAHLALIAAAFLFGTTFVVVQRSVRDLTPVAFLALRFATGAAALAPFAARAPRTPGRRRAGLAVGIVLLAGYLFQTIGLQHTTTSNSAFITGLFVVFTPLAAAALYRRPPTLAVVGGVVIATVGLFFLTGAHFALHYGDALTLGCSVSFGVHIAMLGELAPRHDAMALNAIQLTVVAVGCGLLVPLVGIGHVSARAVAGALFTGIAVSAGAFTLQVVGQRHVGPTRSALLLVLEPVFAGLLGYAVGERLGAVGFLGAALILAGVVVAEVAPARRRSVS